MSGHKTTSLLLRIGPFFLAVVVFLWAAYDGALQVLPHWRTDSSNTAAADDIHTTGADVDLSYDIPEIIDAHLFGAAREHKAPSVANAPETKLRLNLMGLIASANGTLARAMIAVDGSSVKPYSIGQTIEGTKASVHAVEKGRVLLERSNAIESLSLKRTGLGAPIETGPVTMDDTNATTSARLQSRESIQGNELRKRAASVKMSPAF